MALTANQPIAPKVTRPWYTRPMTLLGSALVLAVVAVPTAFVGRTFYWQSQADKHLRPPPTVTTVAEFDAWIGSEARYFVGQDQNGTELIAHV